MKKLIAMLLALVLVMGLVACGNTTNTPATTTEAPAATPEVETTEALSETTETTAAPIEPNAATEVLNAIWDAYEGVEFFAMGGDMNNMVDGAPGNYSLEDEGLTAMLYVPADQVANLTCASSLMHGMMANNFTGAVYQMAEGADAAAFADTMKSTLDATQWMCGMPEKMLIAVMGDEFVFVAFGLNDVISPLETALTTAYADADIKHNVAIAG